MILGPIQFHWHLYCSLNAATTGPTMPIETFLVSFLIDLFSIKLHFQILTLGMYMVFGPQLH